MRLPKYNIRDLLQHNSIYLQDAIFNAWQQRTLFALSKCRTAALGGHIYKCADVNCNTIHISYNSCRNRHCPTCQGHLTKLWMLKRQRELLPVGYFHLVFTLPSALNILALHQPKLVYNTLFKAAWATLKCFAKNPKYLGATTGMIAVLHTWGQNLSLHPHLHCIVPAGGIDKNGHWIHSPNQNKFLFPVKQISAVFRAKYVSLLRKAGINHQKLYDDLFSKPWVVYAKKPFANPKTVIDYLGRYTHKIAISNHRIKTIDKHAKTVSFLLKNYKKQGQKEITTLTIAEFIRRFSLHILPKGFVRIRHFGLLSSTSKRKYLKQLQEQLGAVVSKQPLENTLHLICPRCKTAKLITICTFDTRGPPKLLLEQLYKNLPKTTS